MHPPAVEFFEKKCQVCGMMKCHKMNLKTTNCDFSKRNSLMTVERQTLIVFANQNNGSMDVLFELNERRPNLTCQRHACQMCAFLASAGC